MKRVLVSSQSGVVDEAVKLAVSADARKWSAGRLRNILLMKPLLQLFDTVF
jgi:type IV secretory pathway VirB9-like protein